MTMKIYFIKIIHTDYFIIIEINQPCVAYVQRDKKSAKKTINMVVNAMTWYKECTNT